MTNDFNDCQQPQTGFAKIFWQQQQFKVNFPALHSCSVPGHSLCSLQHWSRTQVPSYAGRWDCFTSILLLKTLLCKTIPLIYFQQQSLFRKASIKFKSQNYAKDMENHRKSSNCDFFFNNMIFRDAGAIADTTQL